MPPGEPPGDALAAWHWETLERPFRRLACRVRRRTRPSRTPLATTGNRPHHKTACRDRHPPAPGNRGHGDGSPQSGRWVSLGAFPIRASEPKPIRSAKAKCGSPDIRPARFVEPRRPPRLAAMKRWPKLSIYLKIHENRCQPACEGGTFESTASAKIVTFAQRREAKILKLAVTAVSVRSHLLRWPNWTSLNPSSRYSAKNGRRWRFLTSLIRPCRRFVNSVVFPIALTNRRIAGLCGRGRRLRTAIELMGHAFQHGPG